MTSPPPSGTDICYLVSHGFAIRMILQTDLLARLRQRGLRVAVVAPHQQDPVLQSYCQSHQIDLYRYPPRSWFWKTHYMLYRMYFLEDLRANPALYEKHWYETHRAQHRYAIQKWMPRMLMLLHPFFKNISPLRKAYWRLEQLFLRSSSARNLLRQIQPGLLVSTYPVQADEGIMLHQARRLGIPTAMHLLSWDNISCKGHFLSLADRYLAWGPVMRQEFMEKYHIHESRIVMTGVPHFDLHQTMKEQADSKRVLTEFGLDVEKPYILFGMSSPRFVPKEIDIVEHLSKKINENVFGSELQMIIRPHPQNVSGWMADPSWITRLQALVNPRIKIFFPMLAESEIAWSMEREDLETLSALLVHARVCINSCSTLSMDSLMAGTGNIAPLFDGDEALPYWFSARRLKDYTHIKKFIELGGTEVVDSFETLESSISQFLKDRNRNAEKRNHAREMECGASGQAATDRVVHALCKIVSED
ncbi:MAG TPA: hypothetical protein VFX48_02160 [Saprospiraceae bacterium]|nr:hypothetical protein [Saprospiraceae bacterium]